MFKVAAVRRGAIVARVTFTDGTLVAIMDAAHVETWPAERQSDARTAAAVAAVEVAR